MGAERRVRSAVAPQSVDGVKMIYNGRPKHGALLLILLWANINANA